MKAVGGRRKAELISTILHPSSLILLLALAALASPARAEELAVRQSAQTLENVLQGEALSAEERGILEKLLRDWDLSECSNPGTGDPRVGRALRASIEGRALSPEEMRFLKRLWREGEKERARARRGEGSPSPPGRCDPGQGRHFCEHCQSALARLSRSREYLSAPLLGALGLGLLLAAWQIKRAVERRKKAFPYSEE